MSTSDGSVEAAHAAYVASDQAERERRREDAETVSRENVARYIAEARANIEKARHP